MTKDFMNTSIDTSRVSAPDEHDLAALLRSAGPRDRATADIEAQVRAAVAAEWRATVASRQRKHRTVTWLAVASVATVAGGGLARPAIAATECRPGCYRRFGQRFGAGARCRRQ